MRRVQRQGVAESSEEAERSGRAAQPQYSGLIAGVVYVVCLLVDVCQSGLWSL
jgi:hypothetical protein